jgi:dienelactone hydrolase
MEPERKSRFTGFRVCRSTAGKLPAPESDEAFFEPFNRRPSGVETSTGQLSSVLAGPAGEIRTPAQWQTRRAALRDKWTKLLGTPSVRPPAPAVKLVATVPEQNYTGELMYLQVEPDYWEKIYILRPHQPRARPVPVVIVPFYDVDVPAGKNLGGRTAGPPNVTSFAYLAAQQGYMAVAIRWFGQSYGEGSSEVVAHLKLRHPQWTGLGKWVWDAQRLLDYLYTLPEVDRKNIGIIGHSLGAKMSLYAAAFDDRITAGVFCEGGIGLTFTNYEDYWYLGETIKAMEKGTDHHELLALIAPRPFLLIGGDSADKDESWHYVNSARQVYSLLGSPNQIGYFNHRKGHTPTPEAVWRSMEWLKRFLGPVN